MRLMTRVFSLLFCGLAAIVAAPALAECSAADVSHPMEFQLAHVDGAAWIIAQGRITETSGADLTAYLSGIDAQPVGVLLNS